MSFHRIYVQPLKTIIITMIIALIVWTIIGICVHRHKTALLFWHVVNTVLFMVALAGILHYTLINRTGNGIHSMPFIRTIDHIQAQPELIREMIMNAFLFFPLGLTMPYALSYIDDEKTKRSVVITIVSALCFSCTIELIQRISNFGNAELSDIVMNTAGATIGSLSFCVTSCGKTKWRK